MKTTMIALALTVMAGFAYGSGNVRLNMNPAEADKAYVEISNATLSQFDIKVEDAYGDLIFSKKTMEPTAAYKRKYDFSALDNGSYTLTVKSEKEVNQTRFSIKNGNIEILEERKIVEPFFKMEENTWKMSYLNFPMEEVNIYVYDRSQLLFEKKIDPVFAVHEGLDLSKLAPGNYEIVITTPKEIFEHEVKVK